MRTTTTPGLFLTILIAASCHMGPAQSPSQAKCDQPEGTVQDYKPPQSLPASIRVYDPEVCAPYGSGYIRVERTHGRRRVGTSRAANGAFNEGCPYLPSEPQNMEECPVINATALMHYVLGVLRAEGIAAVSVGRSPCATDGDDYAAWKISTKVLRWQDAPYVVELLATILETYDVQGFVGAGVQGISCGVAL